MTTLEELGLLKMDFLGLRTLTVIQNAVEMANQRLKAEAERRTKAVKLLDIQTIDYNDKAVLNHSEPAKQTEYFSWKAAG